jgi:hypothetical protein
VKATTVAKAKATHHKALHKAAIKATPADSTGSKVETPKS